MPNKQPTPEQAAEAARTFVERTRRENAARSDPWTYHPPEPTIPLSAVRELLALMERRETHCGNMARLAASNGQDVSASMWMTREAEASYAVRRIREIIPAERR
jgi:hypothetical protein